MTTGAGSSTRKINPMRNSKSKNKNSVSPKSMIGLKKNSSSGSFIKEDKPEQCEKCHGKSSKANCSHLKKNYFVHNSNASLSNMPSKIEIVENTTAR
jgi:hypothetical protein